MSGVTKITQVMNAYAELRSGKKLSDFDDIGVCGSHYASYDPHTRMRARMCERTCVHVCVSAHACTQRRNLRNGVLYMPESPLFIVLCSLLLSLFFCVTNKKRVVTDSNFLKIQTISKGGFFEIV